MQAAPLEGGLADLKVCAAAAVYPKAATVDAPGAVTDAGRAANLANESNVASAAVPRKLGFSFLGEFPDQPEAPAEIGVEWRWRLDRDVKGRPGTTPG